MLIGALLQIIGAVLSLIEMKERRKYLDKKLELEKAWYEEINKPFALRNNAVLDTVEFELCKLSEAISTDLKATQS